MARRIKRDYNEARIPEVIAALGQEKPITKKAACEMLGIAYNTTRLQSIIDEYIQDQENRVARRKAMRGKPVTKEEAQEWANDYLMGGMSLSEIAEFAHRSTSVVKMHLERLGVMFSRTNLSPLNPDMVPEENLREEYEPNQIVYVPGYGCFGKIIKEVVSESAAIIGQKAYRINLMGEHKQYIHVMACDVADLSSLGLNINSIPRMDENDIIATLNEAVAAANKNKVTR